MGAVRDMIQKNAFIYQSTSQEKKLERLNAHAHKLIRYLV